jgi:hypothetical protein
MTVNADEPAVLIHLHLSDNTPVTEEEITLADGNKAKVLWKDVLVEGEYPMSPGPGGATEEPMRVIAQGESDPRTKTISMSDLVEAHNDGAFKYVTIPTTHRDGVLDNTGYVPRPNGVRIIEKAGRKVFQAALGFTEPDVKGKVERGTIPDVSGGIFFNWLNKHTKKRYRCAMKHVSLTPTPFMGNLDPFPAVFASDEEIPDNVRVEVYNLADTPETPAPASDNTGDTAEVVWDETSGMNWLRQRVQSALRPDPPPDDGGAVVPMQPRPYYWVEDLSGDKALVTEEFKGTSTRFVIPFKVADKSVELAPQTRWVEVKEAMIAASDDDADFRPASDVKNKLTLALGEQLGKTGFVYRVEDVSLDGRARVTCNAKGATWIARFAEHEDGSVHIEPSDQWETVKSPASKVSTPAASTVALSDDQLMSRVEEARKQRSLLAQR